MSLNVVINDESQGFVTTHFVANIVTHLLLSLPVKNRFELVNMWQNCRQEGQLMHIDDREQRFLRR